MESPEREIDLIHLLETICRKWRMIIAWMLIGLLLGTVVSIGMAVYYETSADRELAMMSSSKKLLETKKMLLEDENGLELMNDADKNLITYKNKEHLHSMQECYIDNSIYYSIDAENVPKINLNYHIDNHYKATYPVVELYNNIDDLVQYYMDNILSEDACNEIISGVYPESRAKYIRELVKSGRVSTGNFYISIIADTNDNADAIANIIKNRINLISQKVSEIYCEADCTLLSEQFTLENDLDIATIQAASDQKLLDYDKEMQDILKSMSGPQLEYFQLKLGTMEFEESAVEEEHSLIQYISKKLIVLVGIAGIFIALAYIGCIYIFSDNIKTMDDIVTITHSVLLGSFVILENDKKTSWIDNLIEKIFHGSEVKLDIDTRVTLVANTIIEALKSRELNSVCLVGSIDCVGNNSVMMLVNLIAEAGITVAVADNFLHNKNGASLVNVSEMVVIVETVGVSRYPDIEQEMRLLELYKSMVCGCIAV